MFESSLIGLCDKFSHFSMADNSQWIFDRMDEMPESSFSFKCLPKRIFNGGYFEDSLFSLFCEKKNNWWLISWVLCILHYWKTSDQSVLISFVSYLPYKYHTFSLSSCFWSLCSNLIGCNHICSLFDYRWSNCTCNRTKLNLSVVRKKKRRIKWAKQQ